jgi:hypothetical protein
VILMLRRGRLYPLGPFVFGGALTGWQRPQRQLRELRYTATEPFRSIQACFAVTGPVMTSGGTLITKGEAPSRTVGGT